MELKTFKEKLDKIIFGQGNKVHIRFGSSSMCGYWNGYIMQTKKPVTCKKCLEWMKKRNITEEDLKSQSGATPEEILKLSGHCSL